MENTKAGMSKNAEGQEKLKKGGEGRRNKERSRKKGNKNRGGRGNIKEAEREANIKQIPNKYRSNQRKVERNETRKKQEI
jgi:hypothetical protein